MDGFNQVEVKELSRDYKVNEEGKTVIVVIKQVVYEECIINTEPRSSE